MSKQQQSITSLPPSPDEEHRGRVVRYVIAMSVRAVCIVLAFVLTGWLQIVAIIGAVTLPYFAVMLANVKMNQRGSEVVRPGSIVAVRSKNNGSKNNGPKHNGSKDSTP